MLFNSYIFIFVYLPLTLGVFFWLGRSARQTAATAWLVVMSLAFYGWWNPVYLTLILLSMAFNYLIGQGLGRHATGSAPARRLLTLGIAADLLLLGYYKYANFFVDNFNAVSGASLSLGDIVLPLGISFFTFTQIAYLVDAYRGEVREYNPLHYALFVTYFPHLIAGPVLHHKEMMPQFGKASIYRFDVGHFTAGTVYFLMGLFKKVVIADSISGYASPVFATAADGGLLTVADAWIGALAYTFQLYFDFSGYSDMAIGLAMMMGVRLPLNFDSPYKAQNISEFWRRWHMTLSRFLRDYLYIALGGNRKGDTRRYVNLFLTMLLGGLWHGAGWTFVIWGALHGTYLMINHGWQALCRAVGHGFGLDTAPGRAFARALTFLAVVVGWVFFRAEDVESALRILHAMAGQGVSGLSASMQAIVAQADVVRWLALAGLELPPMLVPVALELLLLAIVMWAPNTQQLMWTHYAGLDHERTASPAPSRLRWVPNRAWLAAMSLAGVWALLGLSSVSEFLYFQF